MEPGKKKMLKRIEEINVLSVLLVIGIIKIGSVDYINNGFAGVEYMEGDSVCYIDVSLEGSDCEPEEGGMVLFDNNRIVKCFPKQ